MRSSPNGLSTSTYLLNLMPTFTLPIYQREAETVIATGEERGLESLATEHEGGIFSEKCPGS